MLKNILFLIKILLVSLIWSILYFSGLHFVFSHFWNFDIFYVEYWRTILEFWDGGGIIKTGKDVALIAMIFLALPIWLFSLIKLCKFKYSQIIIYPVKIYDQYQLKKYNPNDTRIVIKNLSTKAEKVTIEDLINQKIKEKKKSKEEDGLEADKIRSSIQDKIKNKK
ncbi:MAG: hypothetical protein ACK5N8_06180 [Alphaproteobacteria bacterium]